MAGGDQAFVYFDHPRLISPISRYTFTPSEPHHKRLRGAEVAAGGVCGGPFDSVRRAQDGTCGGGRA